MKKCSTFNDHATLKQQLSCLRSEIKDKELMIKQNTKNFVTNLPTRIGSQGKKSKNAVKNPIGNILAKSATKTILKREAFFTKQIASYLLKKFGKSLHQKFLK